MKHLYNDIYDDYYKPKIILLLKVIILNMKAIVFINKNLSIKEYLNMIRQYISDIINDHKDEGKC